MKALCKNGNNQLLKMGNLYIVVRGNNMITKECLDMWILAGIALIFRTLPKALDALKAP